MSMLLFYVGKNGYAIENRYILRVLPKVELKTMLSAPSYMKGVLNLSGKAIPVIDFCQLIEKRAAQDLLSSRIILIQDLNTERIVGILGEKVKDFISVQLEEFKSTDFALNPVPFLSGVLSRDHELIQYVDITAFFQFLSTDLFQSIKKEEHES